MTELRITQVRSPIGYPETQRATLRSLGLRKIRQQVIREDSPALRGMLKKVHHLVEIEEAN